MENPEYCRSGITTQQMRNAPIGSLYIWCNGILDYPRKLAEEIGRGDLDFRSPGWMSRGAWYGREYSGVVLDHAAHLTQEQMQMFEGLVLYAESRGIPVSTGADIL